MLENWQSTHRFDPETVLSLFNELVLHSMQVLWTLRAFSKILQGDDPTQINNNLKFKREKKGDTKLSIL